MNKPIVQYDKTKVSVIVLGRAAVIFPIDHPNHKPKHNVSNTQHVLTSRVIKLHHDGSFETLNTIYKPTQGNNHA